MNQAASPGPPLVFNIQRFCTHDGPGIRTVIFLKGCPLKCRWCSNPESQQAGANIFFAAAKCIGCGLCAKSCPKNIPHGRQGADAGCTMCGACVKACPAKALELDGRNYEIDEIIAEAARDESYYGTGGGVTISGGEPLLFPGFVSELADRLKVCGYHLALETTGYAPWEAAGPVFAKMDLILFDIKHMDDGQHRRLTGVSNALILENAAKAAKAGCDILARIPLMGGVNDGEENMRQTAEFCASVGIKRAEFLPYHEFGASKYAMLRREYAFTAERPSPERRKRLGEFFTGRGVEITAGN